MSRSIVVDKSYEFALRMVRLYKYLADEKKEFVLSRNALTTGTMIGARAKAAQEAESRSGFSYEMNLALQKASETEYWLQLLHDGNFLDDEAFHSIHANCVELIKLLKAITRTTKSTI